MWHDLEGTLANFCFVLTNICSMVQNLQNPRWERAMVMCGYCYVCGTGSTALTLVYTCTRLNVIISVWVLRCLAQITGTSRDWGLFQRVNTTSPSPNPPNPTAPWEGPQQPFLIHTSTPFSLSQSQEAPWKASQHGSIGFRQMCPIMPL